MAGQSIVAEEAGADAPSHAKGIVVLTTNFQSRGEVHSFGLKISREGKEFVDAMAGPTRGMRFSDALVRGGHEGENTVLVVPVVGSFDLAPRGFLFENPGTYHLQWDIAFKDNKVARLEIEQAVQVGPALPADLEFLRRVDAPSFMARAFGAEPSGQPPADLLRALVVIAELLERAESHPIEGVQCDPGLPCADELLKLAVELPESSYAPYAAYYAGGMYRAWLERTPESRQVSPALKNHALYQKADEALRFSADHGDPFLKPRALCALAYLRGCSAAWDEADEFLTQATRASSDQGTVHAAVAKLRRDFSAERRSQEQKQKN